MVALRSAVGGAVEDPAHDVGPLGRGESASQEVKGAGVVALDGYDGKFEGPGDGASVETLGVTQMVDIAAARGYTLHDGIDRRGELAHDRAVLAGVVDARAYGVARPRETQAACAPHAVGRKGKTRGRSERPRWPGYATRRERLPGRSRGHRASSGRRSGGRTRRAAASRCGRQSRTRPSPWRGTPAISWASVCRPLSPAGRISYTAPPPPYVTTPRVDSGPFRAKLSQDDDRGKGAMTR